MGMHCCAARKATPLPFSSMTPSETTNTEPDGGSARGVLLVPCDGRVRVRDPKEGVHPEVGVQGDGFVAVRELVGVEVRTTFNLRDESRRGSGFPPTASGVARSPSATAVAWSAAACTRRLCSSCTPRNELEI